MIWISSHYLHGLISFLLVFDNLDSIVCMVWNEIISLHLRRFVFHCLYRLQWSILFSDYLNRVIFVIDVHLIKSFQLQALAVDMKATNNDALDMDTSPSATNSYSVSFIKSNKDKPLLLLDQCVQMQQIDRLKTILDLYRRWLWCIHSNKIE